MALPVATKALLDRLTSAVKGQAALVPARIEPIVPPANPSATQIVFQDDGGVNISLPDGRSHIVPVDFAAPFYAAHVSAEAISEHANRMLDDRTPQLVIQHPETGLVQAIFRADNAEIHDKAREKLEQGRILDAVVQHFQLREQEFEIIQYTPPDER